MPARFVFSDLRELFAKANEEKSGDRLAGIAAGPESERVAAKRKLADLTLAEIVQQPLIDPDEDDVSRLILETFSEDAFRSIKSLTVGEFREHILDDATRETDLKLLQWSSRSLTPWVLRWRVSSACSASGSNPTTPPTTSAAYFFPLSKAFCMDVETR